jgi:hypothetical protein
MVAFDFFYSPSEEAFGIPPLRSETTEAKPELAAAPRNA